MDKSVIKSMLNNPIKNYALPGLTSYKIGGDGFGMVRLFSSERLTHEFITPHSHKFDFTCFVLSGSVINKIFTESKDGDPWFKTEISGEFDYSLGEPELAHFSYYEEYFGAGQSYSMRAEQIHSIEFRKNTEVLFFEGPIKVSKPVILEPSSDGERITTFKTEDWMFLMS